MKLFWQWYHFLTAVWWVVFIAVIILGPILGRMGLLFFIGGSRHSPGGRHSGGGGDGGGDGGG